jgi:ribonucleotide reductase beta subunit family protein with ferritin-like domain
MQLYSGITWSINVYWSYLCNYTHEKLGLLIFTGAIYATILRDNLVHYFVCLFFLINKILNLNLIPDYF